MVILFSPHFFVSVFTPCLFPRFEATTEAAKDRSEKAFQELEMFKTPILPSRYKDVSAIPAFLRQKKAHVPIPMPRKGRISKPSLGMAAKTAQEAEASGHEGKPYARTGGVGKMLARRKAEQEEEQERISVKTTLTSVDEEDEMDTDLQADTHKDIGISTGSASGPEDEHSRARKGMEQIAAVASVVSTSRNDPFPRSTASVPSGRHQPYGRYGRTRTREAGQRSVPLSRPTNRFSAVDEDESFTSVDQSSMDTGDSSDKSGMPIQDRNVPAYEAPAGFSFAKDVSYNIAWKASTDRLYIEGTGY